MINIDLRDHVMSKHEKALELVRCPICDVNGTQAVFMQPRFGDHLRTAHCDEHDVTRHTLIKISHMIPHFHSRRFEMLPPFKLTTDSETKDTEPSSSLSSSSPAVASLASTASFTSSPSPTSSPSSVPSLLPDNKDDRGPCDRVWVTADARQNTVIHHGVTCNHCRTSPIMYVSHLSTL
jgi:hypothetical protein